MQRVELPAGLIDYLDTGTGEADERPVLVFGHGLLMNETQWRKVIPLLDEFRCIAPTWPLGAHRSPMNRDADLTQNGVATIVADFLDALDLTDVTLVLNDWGGGQFIISEGRDERVGRLVLASCEAFDNFPPKPARPAVVLCRLPGGTRVFTWLTGTATFRHGERGYGGLTKRPIPDEVFDDWFAPANRSAAIRRDLRKFTLGTPPRATLLAWSKELASFTRPVLIVWGADDVMMPVEHAHRLVDRFPDSRLVMVDDSRTLISEDQPEAFATALRRFVSELPRTDAPH